MLYNLLVPWASEWTALNVFRYITFRSMAALITALVLSILLGPRFIAWLRRLKCGQHILHEVTAHACKEGTPTMGGLLMLFSLTVSLLLWADLGNFYIWQTLLVFWGFAAVGFWDDMTKLRHAENRGISGRAKLAGQLAVAVVAMLFLVTDPGYSSQLSIPFVKDWAPDLGPLYLPFGVFVMVASSNAVNLTDGLDGLAIGPCIVAGIVFAIFIYVTGHARFANYLLLPYTPGVGEVTVFCAALVGAGLGFLWFNAYPAQVFMGDTGSTFLGYVLAVISVQGLFKMYTLISFVVPFLLFGLPIFDTCFAFIRRIAHGQSPMHADRSHVHHRLIDMGLSQKQAVAVLYVITAILGLSAVVLTTSGAVKAMLLLFAFCAAGAVALSVFHGNNDRRRSQEEEEK